MYNYNIRREFEVRKPAGLLLCSRHWKIQKLSMQEVLRKFRELLLEWTKLQDPETSLLPKISLD